MAKRLNKRDVERVYRQASAIQIPWDDILPQKLLTWLNLYEQATNTPIDMVVPALAALTSCLCGPTTRVQVAEKVLMSPLNLYLVSVSVPGSGKSKVFKNVISDVMQEYRSRHDGKSFLLEQYTSAGVQKHQQDNGGYGLLASHPEVKIFDQINRKQTKVESGRCVMCTLWTGLGDHTVLAAGERGFEFTSMSMMCLVQPCHIIKELSVGPDDGFSDRLLISSLVPNRIHKLGVVIAKSAELAASPMKDFRPLFRTIDEIHRDAHKTYTLDEEARAVYIEYADGYVDYMPKAEPNAEPDDNLQLISSKGAKQVLRLTVVIHILTSVMHQVLDRRDAPTVPSIVPATAVNAAKRIYHTMQQQKSVFLQAADHIDHKDVVSIPKAQGVKERIIRAISTTKGPLTRCRDIQKKLNNVNADMISAELETLQRSGFGTIYTTQGRGKKTVYFKPAPAALRDEDIATLILANATVEQYTTNFNSVDEVDIALRDLCRLQHPHAEVFMDIL